MVLVQCWGGRFRGILACAFLLTATACDDVPTFQELTGQKPPEGKAPRQFVADQPAPPVAPPRVPEKPVVRSPQQILDEFLATEPRMRTNSDLEELAALDPLILQQVTVLDLKDSHVNDPGAKFLAKLPAVEELDISGTPITNAGMQQVAKVKGLRKLRLDRMFIDGEGLAALADHEQMQELSVAETPISDAAFSHLKKMDGLEVLCVSGTRNLQGHGFDELVQSGVMQNLRELQASGTGFGYYGLRSLKSTPALETLLVRGAEISDQAILNIAACRNLKVLDLSQNPIGNEALKLVGRLNQLESLKLIGCVGISDDGLRYLRPLKSLTFLDLTGCRCTPSQVKALKRSSLKNAEIHFADEVY